MEKFSAAEYIRTIAEMKNISAAAEKLDMSQPALSARLKKAEEQLGTAIFDRSRKPLELTEAGRIYLQYAKRFAALDRELQQQIADIEDLEQGSLTIGGASFFNVSYYPKAVGAFLKRHPGIEIEIVDGKIPEISVKAYGGSVDLFIAHPMEFDDRFCYEKLFSERIFLCVPGEWEINERLKHAEVSPESIMSRSESDCAQLPVTDFSLFSGLPFVMLNEDQHIGTVMNSLFAKYGFEPVRRVTAEQTMTSYALTLAGVGISLITESCIRNSGFHDFPKFYFTEPELCSRDIYAVYPKNRYVSRAAREFISILKATLGGS